MSTALSSTEVRAGWFPVSGVRDAFQDLTALLRFRSAALDAKGRRRMRGAGLAVLLLTVAAAVVPAVSPGAQTGEIGRAHV